MKITPDDRARIAAEMEFGLVGALMISNAAFAHVAGKINASHFSDEWAGAVFSTIARLIAAGKAATPLTIAAAEPDSPLASAEGRRYMARAAASVVAIANVPHYARAIREEADRRAASEVLTYAAKRIDAAPMEPGAVTSAIASTIGGLGLIVAGGSNGLVDAGEVVDEIIAGFDRPMAIYPTGMPRLDAAMGGGLIGGKVYGVAARMKHGKSALLSSISYNLAMRDNPVPHLYLGLEMTAAENMQRMIARFGGFNSLAFLDRSPSDAVRQATAAAREAFKARGLWFQFRPRMRLDDLRDVMIRAALSGKVKGIILDYLQLVGGQEPRQSIADHWDHVAQTIAEMAKSYGLWMLVAAQLNRDGEVRGGDGFLNSCDLQWYFHKIEAEVSYEPSSGLWIRASDGIAVGPTPAAYETCDRAWLEMRASRYTRYRDVGTAPSPAYDFVTDSGPYIAER